MDILLIINRLKNHLNIESDSDLAKYLGIKTNTLANWKKRNTFDIDILFTKCEFVFSEWFLKGDYTPEEECECCKEKQKEIDNLNFLIERYENKLGLKGFDESKKSTSESSTEKNIAS